MQHRQRRRSFNHQLGRGELVDEGAAAVETGLRVGLSGVAALTVYAVLDGTLGGWVVDFDAATACVAAGGQFVDCIPDRLQELFSSWGGNYGIDLGRRR